MSPDTVLKILCGVHVLLCAASFLRMRSLPGRINYAFGFWMWLLPVFGPLACFFLRTTGKSEMDTESAMDENLRRHQSLLGVSADVREIVPLEEAMLMNDLQKRRMLIMNAVRTDPVAYLDVLLVARFNEDTETAHYAASTIMEVQRKMQMALQELAQKVASQPESLTLHKQYIDLLARYCDSKLLEGELLRKQRVTLKRVLKKTLEMEDSVVLRSHLIATLMALGELKEAQSVVQSMLAKWPMDEIPWLEAMRIAVEADDQEAVAALLEKMKKTSIDWTKSGRTLIGPWVEAVQ